MKTIRNLSLSLLIMLVVTMVEARPVETTLEITGETTFKLVLNNQVQDIQIRLKDNYGYTLYNDQKQGLDSYTKLINTERLPDGVYYLELDYQTKIQTYRMKLTNGVLKLAETGPREYFKPVIRQVGDRVAVTQLTMQLEPLTVMIYDEEGRLLLQDKLSGKRSLGRQYDMSTLESGDYKFYTISKGRESIHVVTL